MAAVQKPWLAVRLGELVTSPILGDLAAMTLAARPRLWADWAVSAAALLVQVQLQAATVLTEFEVAVVVVVKHPSCCAQSRARTMRTRSVRSQLPRR